MNAQNSHGGPDRIDDHTGTRTTERKISRSSNYSKSSHSISVWQLYLTRATLDLQLREQDRATFHDTGCPNSDAAPPESDRAATFTANFQAHIVEVVGIQGCLASSAILRSLIRFVANFIEMGHSDKVLDKVCDNKLQLFRGLGAELAFVQVERAHGPSRRVRVVRDHDDRLWMSRLTSRH